MQQTTVVTSERLKEKNFITQACRDAHYIKTNVATEHGTNGNRSP